MTVQPVTTAAARRRPGLHGHGDKCQSRGEMCGLPSHQTGAWAGASSAGWQTDPPTSVFCPFLLLPGTPFRAMPEANLQHNLGQRHKTRAVPFSWLWLIEDSTGSPTESHYRKPWHSAKWFCSPKPHLPSKILTPSSGASEQPRPADPRSSDRGSHPRENSQSGGGEAREPRSPPQGHVFLKNHKLGPRDLSHHRKPRGARLLIPLQAGSKTEPS